jgi:hypothetical protein
MWQAGIENRDGHLQRFLCRKEGGDMTIEMAPSAELTIDRYYDSHPTEKDLVGQSIPPLTAVDHLHHVLKCQFREEKYLIALDYNLYVTRDPDEVPVMPDVMLFKCMREDELPICARSDRL